MLYHNKRAGNSPFLTFFAKGILIFFNKHMTLCLALLLASANMVNKSVTRFMWSLYQVTGLDVEPASPSNGYGLYVKPIFPLSDCGLSMEPLSLASDCGLDMEPVDLIWSLYIHQATVDLIWSL